MLTCYSCGDKLTRPRTITGLCQTCQDEYFEPDPPGGYGVCRDTGTLSQEDIDGCE